MNSENTPRGPLRRFFALPTFFKVMFLPTWISLGLARIIVLTIPFRFVASTLGYHTSVYPAIPLVDKQATIRARQISRLIIGTAKYCPWDANCFAQALTARLFLKIFDIPHAICFGLKRNNQQKLDAHAWVCAGAVRVTGGYSFDQYAVVNSYVSIADWITPK